MSAVRVNTLDLTFHNEQVLTDINFHVEDGELCVILGPSGSGKSMLLKSIAGLVPPDNGTIVLRGADATADSTASRDIGYVFQEFEETLFPHKTVEENIQFGLDQQEQELDPSEIQERIDDMLELLAIEHTKDDYPAELSGGQQQRVEIARQVVRRCDLMLLDDPLADLDYKLEKRMEIEMRRIHRDLGSTFVYVTHNQDQGLRLADKVVVLNQGQIEQIGTPDEVYQSPKNAFVALFVGDNNAIRGKTIELGDDSAVIDTTLGRIKATNSNDVPSGKSGIVTIRPEHIRLGDATGENTVTATVQTKTFMGEQTELLLETEDGRQLVVTEPGQVHHEPTETISLQFPPEYTQFFDKLSVTDAVTVEDLLTI